MFWRFTYSTSKIQTLLDQPDVTLKEILDEEDVLQECKSNNEKLINFLTDDDNLGKLLDYIVTEPFTRMPDSNDESVIADPDFFKYPLIACEVLICDQLYQVVNDKLIGNATLMSKLYDFLKYDYINPVLMSYYVKIIGSLITKKPQQFLDYIETKETEFLELFLKHMSTSSIVDIIRLLVTIDTTSALSSMSSGGISNNNNNNNNNRAIQWLKKIHLVDHLIELFSSSKKLDTRKVASIYCNASQAICDMIRITREQLMNVLCENNMASLLGMSTGVEDPAFGMDHDGITSENSNNRKYDVKSLDVPALVKSSILEDIESEATINKLLDFVFEKRDELVVDNNSDGHRESPIVYIIEILLTILDNSSLNQSFFNFNQINDSEQERLRRDKDKKDIIASGTQTLTKCCINRLVSFNELLTQSAKPKHDFIKLSNGNEIKSLGLARLYIIKLIAKLISLNDANFNRELIVAGTIKTIMDMSLFDFKWNNFLHTQLIDILKNCVNSDLKYDEDAKAGSAVVDTAESNEPSANKPTLIPPVENSFSFIQHFLVYCNLIPKLITIWTEYFTNVDKLDENRITFHKSNQVGYIGHVTLLTNMFANKDPTSAHSVLIQSYMNKLVPKEVLEQWEELNNTKVKTINGLNAKDLVKNPFSASSMNDSFLAQHQSAFGLPDDDEKINRCFNEIKQEIKISCVQEFGLSESNITSFPQEWNLNRASKPSSFFVGANNESAQMFEQICQQRESMNLGMGGASTQADDDDVWITKEIQFSKPNEANPSKGPEGDDNMFGTFGKKDSHLLGTNKSGSSSSSSSSSDDDDNDPFKMTPNKRHQQISIEHRETTTTTSMFSTTMDGKGLDLGLGSMDTSAPPPSRTSASVALSQLASRSSTREDNKNKLNLFDEEELKGSGGGELAAKDILPIDKDPWADVGAANQPSSNDPNDLFASAPPTAFENNTNTNTASTGQDVDTTTTTTTTETAKKDDDQGWANFDNAT